MTRQPLFEFAALAHQTDVSTEVAGVGTSQPRGPAASRQTLIWVVKRAVFGLAVLLSVSLGAAMLLDASIDGQAAEQASE